MTEPQSTASKYQNLFDSVFESMYFLTTEQAFALSFQFVIQQLLIKFKCFMRAMCDVSRLSIND